MTKKALIIDNTIAEVHEVAFQVSAPWYWLDCPDDARPGWRVDNAVTPSQVVGPDVTDVETAKAAVCRDLAGYRYAIETGGLNGIATDDRAKTLLAGARIEAAEALSAGRPYEVQWKTADGWATCTAAQVIAISDAVRGFVQACFDVEKTHWDALQALTTTEEVLAYDYTIGWPGGA